MKFLLQKMSGFQNGCDKAHLVKFADWIDFMFKYLKASEIWEMAIADVFFLYFSGYTLWPSFSSRF